jgi:hypothetical protein
MRPQRLKSLRKSTCQCEVETGAKSPVDFRKLYAALKRRFSTALHAFVSFSAACEAAFICATS